MVVWASGMVGNLAIPIVLLLVVGGDRVSVGISIGIAVLTLIASAVRWSRFRYRIDERALYLRGGLLQRWERTLQLPRIQSVDVVQKLTHRAFGVVELRVEVVGGQGTEAALVALTPDDARELRALLMSDHVEDERGAAEAPPPLVRMPPRALLLAGVTGGRVAVLAAIVAWAFQVLPEGTVVETLDRLAGADRSQLETIAIVAGTLVLASILISLVSTILVYWDFTAVRRGDRLVITRGLLQTRRSVVPVARIQSVRLEENLIRRAFGLASLRVLTAGYGRGSGDEQQTSMLVPVATREACLAVAATVMGSEELVKRRLEPAPGSALALRICRATILGVVALVTGLIVSDGEFFVLAIPILPVAIAVAVLSWRALGHAVLGEHVVARWGGLVRSTALADQRNIQHLSLRSSPAQRVFGLASVGLAIPKASTALIDVDREVAEERFEELSARLVR